MRGRGSGTIGLRRARRLGVLTTALLGLTFALDVLPGSPASAASPLNVFVGYFDTHSVPFSANQPSPWPYQDPASFDGTPCPGYPNATTCWDAGAIRLDNPTGAAVTGVKVVVTIGSRTYALWGSSLTVKASGMLVLTETGSSSNSENFDGSDEPPNSYNGGNPTSCANSGAIPNVQITIGGITTSYLDTGQVLNTAGVDIAHCSNGSFVSGRMDESHPWVQIGTASVVAPTAPQSLAATASSGSVSLTWNPPASNGGAAITGYDIYRGTSAGGESATPVATSVTTTSFTDTGLTNGTTYYYKVAAVNSAGVSPQSGEASATPQAVAPSAPLNVVASPGNAQVTVSWSVPASDGGAAITGYDVYRGTSPGGESATPVAANVTTTSFTDTGLTNGTTYYYKVAAVNSAGISAQSSEASATPAAPAAAAFVRRVVSATASSARTTTTVTVSSPGVPAGNTVVVSLLLSTTDSLTGAVTATDSAGNSYLVARDNNDGSAGDRTVMLVSVAVKALASGATITLTYPSSAETHVSVDEFAGVTGIDASAGATGTTAAFSSGTVTTTRPGDLLISMTGDESGSAPVFSTSWTSLPLLSVSSDHLDTAYQLVSGSGSFAATGTTGGQWMASIVALATS